MRHMDIALQMTWILAGVVWLLGCLSPKRIRQIEPRQSRFLHLVWIATAFALLFSDWLRIGVLGVQVVPNSESARYLGLTLTIVGVIFAIWGRISLGGNWSGVVTIKEEHELIRHGPYAWVRHPIYSGFLLAMLGTALAYGRLGCLIALPIGFAAWWTKSRVEERFLLSQFGDTYRNYQRNVRAIIPFVF